MSGRFERLLLVAAPVVAMATVGVGLRVGAGDAVRAPVVTGALPSAGATGLAWQVVVLDEDLGVRRPVRLPSVEVVATEKSGSARWAGPTNEDGTAEVFLPLPFGPLDLQVTSGGKLLAQGAAVAAPSPSPPPPLTAWARFARREGDVSLDVAVLGQRASSGFPASLWIKAVDAATHAPLDGVTIDLEPDPSLTPAASTVTTDLRGWAHITATPMGYSIPVILHAKARDGRTGEWAGGLFVSPGAAELVLKDVYGTQEPVTFDVVVPTVRTTAYVEIDDLHGRAWAAAPALPPSSTGAPRASVTGPKLPAGLYWVVAAGDPTGAAAMGPGSMARPFFVADSAEAALRFGTDPTSCAAPGDMRDGPRVVSTCLSLVAPVAAVRWVALDGFAFQRQRDAQQRARGMTIALGAVLLATLLEAVLLLRLAATARARMRAAEATEEGGNARLAVRVWGIVIAVLVGMLGFALLGAFLVRLA